MIECVRSDSQTLRERNTNIMLLSSDACLTVGDKLSVEKIEVEQGSRGRGGRGWPRKQEVRKKKCSQKINRVFPGLNPETDSNDECFCWAEHLKRKL